MQVCAGGALADLLALTLGTLRHRRSPAVPSALCRARGGPAFSSQTKAPGSQHPQDRARQPLLNWAHMHTPSAAALEALCVVCLQSLLQADSLLLLCRW